MQAPFWKALFKFLMSLAFLALVLALGGTVLFLYWLYFLPSTQELQESWERAWAELEGDWQRLSSGLAADFDKFSSQPAEMQILQGIMQLVLLIIVGAMLWQSRKMRRDGVTLLTVAKKFGKVLLYTTAELLLSFCLIVLLEPPLRHIAEICFVLGFAPWLGAAAVLTSLPLLRTRPGR